MHNNYMDILGQMGLVGIGAFWWLGLSCLRLIRRSYLQEPPGFGRGYVVACLGGFVGTLFAGALADWFFPFVYNVGLRGFRESYIGWLLLGGLVLLDATRDRTGGETTSASAPVAPPTATT